MVRDGYRGDAAVSLSVEYTSGCKQLDGPTLSSHIVDVDVVGAERYVMKFKHESMVAEQQ